MLELNKVLLLGNLTRDPELSYIASGTALAKLRLAVNRSFRDRGGENRRETAFIDVDVWGNQAEACGKYLQKGRRVFVEGRLRYDEWEGNDGSKRNKLTVTADRVQFADSRTSDQDGSSSYDDGSGDSDDGPPSRPPQRQSSPPPRPGNRSQQAPQSQSNSSFPSDGADEGFDETADDLPF